MDEIEIEQVTDIDITNPILIEGLPGVGHVGKLAAEHLIEEKDSTLVRRIYSEHFPPQVLVNEDGKTELAHAEIYAINTTSRDLLVLTGDQQAQSNEGHYRLTKTFLKLAREYDVEQVFALGGVPTGELVEEYTVLGAVTDIELKEDLLDAGVEFRGEEPAGGIVGTSGLLLGLGERQEMKAVCLMGETSGYLVDPKSAQAVLEVLEDLYDLDLEYDSLEDRAEEMEEVMSKIQEMEQGS
ncbi:MAG: proteasome assembly chaperone family protein, partial [Halobacteriaceae archaeon]